MVYFLAEIGLLYLTTYYLLPPKPDKRVSIRKVTATCRSHCFVKVGMVKNPNNFKKRTRPRGPSYLY